MYKADLFVFPFKFSVKMPPKKSNLKNESKPKVSINNTLDFIDDFEAKKNISKKVYPS